jgi:CBS domain-containing protein
MKVRDLMTPDVEVVTPDDTLRTAAQLMVDLGSAALPVGEGNQLIGMITDRDIAIRVAAEGWDPEKVTVSQAMSSDALYCFENEDIEDVSEKMGNWWIRRLPVVSGDKRLIGTVCLGDLTPLAAPTQPPRLG